MPRMQSFEKLELFYNVLADYRNIDNYSLASPAFAAERSNIPSASAKTALRVLRGMGCLNVYVADREQPGVTLMPDDYVHEGNRKMILVQLTAKVPTRELYGMYLVDSASKGLRTV